MRLTAEEKRDIERVLLETHDALVAIKEKTGYSVSVAAYGNDKDYACIFIHTKQGLVNIDERSEIEGIFKSDKWRNRRKKDS